MTTVPPAIRAGFLAALQPLSKHAAALPDPLPVGGRAIRLSDAVVQGQSAESVQLFTQFFIGPHGQDGRGQWIVVARRAS
jgi:hypothetical protein